MAARPILDLELLSSFLTIAEERSFTRAAERIGRTQSAVSLQLQRLESSLGHKLLERDKGGSVSLTAQGRQLFGLAREMLTLNDSILRSITSSTVSLHLRLGLPDELSGRPLSRIIEGFAARAPSVEVAIVTAPSCLLASQFKNGKHDLVILDRGLEPRNYPAEVLSRRPMRWITSVEHRQHLRDPLPLTTSNRDCPFRPPWLDQCLSRETALGALDRAGRRYAVVNSSTTTTGQFAAVAAGVAVAASMATWLMPEGLREVRDDEGLPTLPASGYLMLKARDPHHPMTDMLAAHIREVMASEGAGP